MFSLDTNNFDSMDLKFPIMNWMEINITVSIEHFFKFSKNVQITKKLTKFSLKESHQQFILLQSLEPSIFNFEKTKKSASTQLNFKTTNIKSESGKCPPLQSFSILQSIPRSHLGNKGNRKINLMQISASFRHFAWRIRAEEFSQQWKINHNSPGGIGQS